MKELNKQNRKNLIIMIDNYSVIAIKPYLTQK